MRSAKDGIQNTKLLPFGPMTTKPRGRPSNTETARQTAAKKRKRRDAFTKETKMSTDRASLFAVTPMISTLYFLTTSFPSPGKGRDEVALLDSPNELMMIRLWRKIGSFLRKPDYLVGHEMMDWLSHSPEILPYNELSILGRRLHNLWLQCDTLSTSTPGSGMEAGLLEGFRVAESAMHAVTVKFLGALKKRSFSVYQQFRIDMLQ
jgi:hypothetical protein